MNIKEMTKGMKRGERRPMFGDGYLEYDNKGLLYFNNMTPAFLLEPGGQPGEAFIINGVHQTWDTFIDRVMDGDSIDEH